MNALDKYKNISFEIPAPVGLREITMQDGKAHIGTEVIQSKVGYTVSVLQVVGSKDGDFGVIRYEGDDKMYRIDFQHLDAWLNRDEENRELFNLLESFM